MIIVLRFNYSNRKAIAPVENVISVFSAFLISVDKITVKANLSIGYLSFHSYLAFIPF